MNTRWQIVLTVQHVQLEKTKSVLAGWSNDWIVIPDLKFGLDLIRCPNVQSLNPDTSALLHRHGIAHDILIRDKQERRLTRQYLRFDRDGRTWISQATPLHLVPLVDPERSPCKEPILFRTSWECQVENGKTYRLLQHLASNA